MINHALTGNKLLRFLAAAALASGLLLSLAVLPGLAETRDSDGDGMPNRWERNHGLDAHRPNAIGDPDHDRLTNLQEYKKDVLPHDEDSDNDGMDDGDEVKDERPSTDVDDPDTNNDGEEDGDEDADRDGLDNEDEDDAREVCLADDDDSDSDGIDNEDENDFGTQAHDDDSDDDGVVDGNEDMDEDGSDNEDEDDSDSDECEVEGEDSDDEDSDDEGADV